MAKAKQTGQTQTGQKSTISKKIQLSVEKRIRAWSKRVTSVLSITNASISVVANSINLIIRPIVAANVLLSNIGISVFFNAISFTLNMHSLVNHFREKKILKKFNMERTEDNKKRSKNKLQCICLDLLCDMFFFASAVVSLALFGNPIVLSISMPFLVLGGLVMTGSIVKSTIHQYQEYKHHLNQPEGQEKEAQYKKDIKTSRVHRIMRWFLPESIVLAKWHAQQEDKREKLIIKCLRKNPEKLIGRSNEIGMTDIQHENPAIQELDSQNAPKADVNGDKQNQGVALEEPAVQLNDQNEPETTPRERSSSTVGSDMKEVTAQQKDSNVQTTSL